VNINKKLILICLGSLAVLLLVVFNDSLNENVNNKQDDLSSNEEKIIEYSDDYKEVIAQIEKSNDIINFLNNNNFKYISSENDVDIDVADIDTEEFYNLKKGKDVDFAFFIGKTLSSINYIPFIFTYEDDLRAYYVVAFRDTDLPKYIYVDEGGVHMVHHGWSFKDLCKKEEERLGIKIKRYGTIFFSENLKSLSPTEWIDY